MDNTTGTPPVVLIAAARERALTSGLQDYQYAAVVHVHTGTLALEWAPDLRPDTIILDADLPDMSGIDACRLLHNDPRIGHSVPILILAPDKPTPEQRVTGLRAGAWDFLRYPWDIEDLALKLQTYVQAKRNIDVALAEGLVDPTAGLHSRPALARRARELGALMARKRGALACVVFSLESDPMDAKAASLMVRTARVCDVVGALSPTEFAVLAPATDHAGAVRLAQRVADALRDTVGEPTPDTGSGLRAGYDAVTNFGYSPMDPVELLAHATAAVRNGTPEPGHPWVRRFDVSTASGQDAGPTSRTAPSGHVSDKGRP
jgi:DNA-binding response OmpR family regulator